MYENVVKELRNLLRAYKATDNENCHQAKILTDAVDAIESTSKAYQIISEAYEAEVIKQGWIPVTDHLPEERTNPNTHDFEYVLCATIWGDVRPFKYGTPIGQKEAHFWNGSGYVDAYITHWMPMPEPPKEET